MNFVTCHPPPADTLEISLFGTGVGEGLAVHLGDGNWALVDTCREISNGIPLNLAYLESIGVDVEVAVKIIIATHWHDDHVDGLSNIIDRCPNARLAFSQALACDEFLSLVQLYGDHLRGLSRNNSVRTSLTGNGTPRLFNPITLSCFKAYSPFIRLIPEESSRIRRRSLLVIR